jgi:hypothetical protein
MRKIHTGFAYGTLFEQYQLFIITMCGEAIPLSGVENQYRMSLMSIEGENAGL